MRYAIFNNQHDIMARVHPAFSLYCALQTLWSAVADLQGKCSDRANIRGRRIVDRNSMTKGVIISLLGVLGPLQ